MEATGLGRAAAGFGVALAGMLAVGAWLSDTSTCWLAWIAAGLVAGAITGGGRSVLVVGLALLAYFPLAAPLGLPSTGVAWPYWALLSVVGATVVAGSAALGTLLRRGSGRAGRGTVAGAVLLGLVGVAAWVGYAGHLGSESLLHPAAADKWAGCDTPMSRFGWPYEAVNYDAADDARLAAANPDQQHCTGQGSVAGAEVVASDGVPIAGWYIPAASGAGPSAPTIVIAPGWKSNKSGILKYAPPFHQDFNLLLVDLRNGGRSGSDTTTYGYRERLDVRAMVDWLERTKAPSWIGATGNSMGAVTVLAEAMDDPRIGALILDSMHGDVVNAWGDGLEFEAHVPGYPTAWATVGLASLKMGADLRSIDPVRTITRMGDRPVLLLHGTADGLDRPERSAELVYAAGLDAGVPIALHYCEGARHGAVINTCPDEWAALALAFLDAAVPEAAARR